MAADGRQPDAQLIRFPRCMWAADELLPTISILLVEAEWQKLYLCGKFGGEILILEAKEKANGGGWRKTKEEVRGRRGEKRGEGRRRREEESGGRRRRMEVEREGQRRRREEEEEERWKRT